MFALNGQSLGYGKYAVLNDICLKINAGERVSLLGRSGAGKSTLLQALYAQVAGQAALVPQDAALVHSLSVFHNVYMGRLHAHPTWYNLRNLVWPAASQIEAMAPLVERLGLSAKLKARVGELSGGQRQRVAVARAVHQRQPVLIGDEPVSSVDQRQARDVLDLIQERHHTVLLAMHDVDLALAYSDRIIGLDRGRIVINAPACTLTPAQLAPLYAADVPIGPGVAGRYVRPPLAQVG